MLSLRREARLFLLVILGIVSLLSPLQLKADRGMIPIMPSVLIYEPSQKAIIAWNGKTEVLILSTDVYSSQKTKVLEILPLPSNPERIEKGSFESFEAVNELIFEHAPKIQGYRQKDIVALSNESVTILFKAKIGVHDITVVKTKDSEELAYWIQDFLRKNGLDIVLNLGSAEKVIDEYTSLGFRFFVLDIIEVSDEKSVEPILYEFKTPFLYYPLKISSIIPGDTKISLFLITTEKVSEKLLHESSMKMAYYKIGKEREPIQFKISLGEISRIDLRLTELFDEEAWFTAVFYEGNMNQLRKDLKIAYPLETGNEGLGSVLRDPTDFVIGMSMGFLFSLLAFLSGRYMMKKLGKD